MNKRGEFIILTAYGVCVLVTAGLIVGSMIVRGVKKHRAHYEKAPVQVEQVKR